VLLRGGGSADDLGAFNDELLVREIAASRVPTLVGVGHEVDVSLADLVADVRAATPSNAAQILVPDKSEVIRNVSHQIQAIVPTIERAVVQYEREVRGLLESALNAIDHRLENSEEQLANLGRVLMQLDPRTVLARGYAIIRGDIREGSMIEIEKSDILITAEVRHVNKK
jgi:exodeoxyribonuclease VII large subunit